MPGKATWKVAQAAVAVALKSWVAVGGTGVAAGVWGDAAGGAGHVGHCGKNAGVAGHAVAATAPLPGVTYPYQYRPKPMPTIRPIPIKIPRLSIKRSESLLRLRFGGLGM